MISSARIPILGIVGFSGMGKTSLLLKILPQLKARGVRVGMIKHAHHQFEIDQPQKDSYRLRKQGEVSQLLLASRQRWVLMTETGDSDEACLQTLLTCLDQQQLDLILVEGFKHEAFPKLEVHRPSVGRALLFPEDSHIIAIASDTALSTVTQLPVFDLNAAEQIVHFIVDVVMPTQLAAII